MLCTFPLQRLFFLLLSPPPPPPPLQVNAQRSPQQIMSIPVGIDVGNDKCVIAVVKDGVVDAILNEDSNRETPTVVRFANNHRLFGSTGAGYSVTNPASTISQLKRLVGRRFDEPGIERELGLLPYVTCKGANGGISVKVRYLGEDRVLTAVELLGMLLSHLRRTAERALGSTISDCVIGVPAYFTDLQRREYLHAAEIAGLKPRRLFHDGAATALGFGFYRKVPPCSHAVFVDIGHCDTQVTVVRFEATGMSVLAHAFDRDLGGRDFDEVILRYFHDEILARQCCKGGGDVRLDVKEWARLTAACARAKRDLSAGMEARIRVECRVVGEVEGTIKRDGFEKLSGALLHRIVDTCRKALSEARVSAAGVHYVEMVGSGSRIPAISKILECRFRWRLSRTLSGSECVACGCALQCAMLSSQTPLLRRYEVRDIFPFSIVFSTSESGGSAGKPILIRKHRPIPSYVYHREASITEVAYAEQTELPPGTNKKIGRFEVRLLDESGKYKLNVGIGLDIHGIVSVMSTSYIEDDVKVPDCSIIPHLNSEGMETNDAHDKEVLPNDAATHEKLTTKFEVTVGTSIDGGTTGSDLSRAKAQEAQLLQQDRVIEHLKDRSNQQASDVYDIRAKIPKEYKRFIYKHEKDQILEKLQEIEDRLATGYDESREVDTLLQEVRALISPVEARYMDGKELPVLETGTDIGTEQTPPVGSSTLPPEVPDGRRTDEKVSRALEKSVGATGDDVAKEDSTVGHSNDGKKWPQAYRSDISTKHEEYEKFLNRPERYELSRKLKEVQLWLQEGEDIRREDACAAIEELRTLILPTENRRKERIKFENRNNKISDEHSSYPQTTSAERHSLVKKEYHASPDATISEARKHEKRTLMERVKSQWSSLVVGKDKETKEKKASKKGKLVKLVSEPIRGNTEEHRMPPTQSCQGGLKGEGMPYGAEHKDVDELGAYGSLQNSSLSRVEHVNVEAGQPTYEQQGHGHQPPIQQMELRPSPRNQCITRSNNTYLPSQGIARGGTYPSGLENTSYGEQATERPSSPSSSRTTNSARSSHGLKGKINIFKSKKKQQLNTPSSEEHSLERENKDGHITAI